MSIRSLSYLTATLLTLAALPLAAQNSDVFRPSDVQHGVSIPVRDMPLATPDVFHPHVIPLRPTHPVLPTSSGQTDAVAQTSATAPLPLSLTPGLNIPGVGMNFVGLGGVTFTPDSAPPDPNGAVGATQYVQWVNESFAVFDKTTGAVVAGPTAGNSLFASLPNSCATNNDGDPIVLFDHFNQRWVMTQFSVTGGPPFLQCVAVSQTSDATGNFNVYSFTLPNFNDYPKLGIWSNAYYMTFNMFGGRNNNTYLGPMVCAFDSAAMVAASTSPASVCTQQLPASDGSLLPADIDGATAPPTTEGEYLVGFDPAFQGLDLYQVTADLTAGTISMSGPTLLSTDSSGNSLAFTEACGGGVCIPQAGTQKTLDSLADRPMYRFAWRSMINSTTGSPYEAMVVNHTVAGSNFGTRKTPASGVRWYEIRSTGSASTATVYQAGTFTPDSEFRWMGSIAMDQFGNIALGYSISSSFTFPGINFTGRASTDPLGTLAQETTMTLGKGSQTKSLNRWGDYTSMSVDPTDDCTFWYTNEFLPLTGTFNWSTQIATYKLPGCP